MARHDVSQDVNPGLETPVTGPTAGHVQRVLVVRRLRDVVNGLRSEWWSIRYRIEEPFTQDAIKDQWIAGSPAGVVLWKAGPPEMPPDRAHQRALECPVDRTN